MKMKALGGTICSATIAIRGYRMNRKDFDTELRSFITDLVGRSAVPAENATEIYSYLKKLIADREEYLVEGLVEKVTNWESTMGEEDKSLYSLGLRHAIDFIRGIEPTVAKDYKPMGEDFRSN